jgi:hypothetical protein
VIGENNMAKNSDNPEKVVEQSAAAVQKTVDEINEKGYHGEAVDETPRENYTVEGVTSGKETPETTKLEKK